MPAMCSVGRHNTRLVPSHPPTMRRRANAMVIVKLLPMPAGGGGAAGARARGPAGVWRGGGGVRPDARGRRGRARFARPLRRQRGHCRGPARAPRCARRAPVCMPRRGRGGHTIDAARQRSLHNLFCCLHGTRQLWCLLKSISGRHQATLPACTASRRRCVCLGAGWTAEPMTHAIEQ